MSRRAMRSGGILVVLLFFPLSGCFTINDVRTSGVFIDFPEETLVAYTTSTPRGALVYEVESPMNASFALRYEFPWDSTRLNPVNVLFIEEGGDTWTPFTLRSEGDPLNEPSEVYLGVEDDQHHVTSVPGDAPKRGMSGIELHYTDALRGWLVVTWANLSGPLSLQTYWTSGTLLERTFEGDGAMMHNLHTLRGGVRTGTPAAMASWGTTFSVGETGQQVLTGLKIHQPWVSKGSVTITSEDGTRTIAFDGALEPHGQRWSFTTTGRTTFTLHLVGVTHPQITFLSAPLPPGTLPPVWSKMLEQS